MSLMESGDSTGEVSLASLMAGESPTPGPSSLSLDEVIALIRRGGWPGVMDLSADDAQVIAHSYLSELAESDISDVDKIRRDPVKVMALLRSLARHTATIAQVPTIRRDMTEQFGTAATDLTIRAYLDALQRLYVLEEIPAWAPHLRSSAALRTSPKRLLVDPSLAAAGLGATHETLRNDLNTLGFLFESMVLRDLLIYATMSGGAISHYRDDAGLEADCIVTMPDGRWGAFEIKLGFNQVDEAANHLRRLANKLTNAGQPPPTALTVIVGIGSFAHTRPDGVHVIPLDQLGA
jgi:predicted AAA+ superfamily ATPase